MEAFVLHREGILEYFVLNRVRILNPQQYPIAKHGSSTPPPPAGQVAQILLQRKEPVGSRGWQN